MHVTSRQTLLDWGQARSVSPGQSLPAALALCSCPGPGALAVAVRQAAALARLPLPRGWPGVLRRLQLAGAGPPSRLALLELPLLAMLLVLWRKPLADTPRQALLLALALNIGALLALVGQTYQTGADPWQLFATWALLLLPPGGARQKPAALDPRLAARPAGPGVSTWRLGLIDLFFSFNEEALGWCLTLLNAALWGLLILAPARLGLMPSWLPGLAAGLGVTLLALLALFDAASPWVWPAWLAWLGAAYLRWHHRFIAGLAMGV